MIPDRIKISREFKDNILGGLWLGIEATVSEREDITEAFSKAYDEITIAAKAVIKDGISYEATECRIQKHESLHPMTNRIESIIRDINSCKEKKVLESYKLIAKTDEKLQSAYDKKMLEFQ